MTKYFIIFIMLCTGSVYTQTGDDQFDTFFKSFSNAVKGENVSEIAEFINFPFHSYWGNGEYWITKESFWGNNKYHTVIPQFNILSKAKFNKQTTITDQGMKFDVNFSLENGTYVISYLVVSEEEGDDAKYCFALVNGEYRYSKMINSEMNGPPYENSK